MSIKESREEIIERAVANGLIGSALGALLTGKGKHSEAANLAGVAIGASINAHKEVALLDRSVLYEEQGRVYRKSPDGSIELVKKLKASRVKIPSFFTLE